MSQTQVQSGFIEDSSITTSKLDGTVGSEAVTTAKIRDSNVTTAKLDGTVGSEAVTTAKIRDANVTPGKLSTGGPSWNATGSLTIGGLPFLRNIPTISTDYTITPTYNEMSIGPITINSGVTVIVNSGATWTVV